MKSYSYLAFLVISVVSVDIVKSSSSYTLTHLPDEITLPIISLVMMHENRLPQCFNALGTLRLINKEWNSVIISDKNFIWKSLCSRFELGEIIDHVIYMSTSSVGQQYKCFLALSRQEKPRIQFASTLTATLMCNRYEKDSFNFIHDTMQMSQMHECLPDMYNEGYVNKIRQLSIRFNIPFLPMVNKYSCQRLSALASAIISVTKDGIRCAQCDRGKWLIELIGAEYKKRLEENKKIYFAPEVGPLLAEYAIKYNALPMLKALFSSYGVDKDARLTPEHATFLMRACERKNREMVTFFINLHPKIYAVNSVGQTAYEYVPGNNSIEKLLRKKNILSAANAQTPDTKGDIVSLWNYVYTKYPLSVSTYLVPPSTIPLHYAVSTGIPAVVRIALMCQEDSIDVKDDQGRTPLMKAAQGGFVNVVKFLLKHGASKKAKDNNGKRVWQYAARGGDPEMLTLLPPPYNNVVGIYSHEQRNTAAAYGNTRALAALIKDKSEVDKRILGGRTASAAAVANNQLETLQWLLNQGASATITNSDSNGCPLPLLDQAIYFKCSIPLLKTLIEKGALVNGIEKARVNPLSCALIHGNDNDGVVEFLIKHKVDCNAVKNGKTPLSLAAHYNRSHAFKLLLKNGANPNVPSRFSEYGLLTPLEHIIKKKNITLLKRLIKYGKELDINTPFSSTDMTPLMTMLQMDWKEGSTLLLSDPRLQVDASAKRNFTAFAVAIYNNKENEARQLLEKNANPYCLISLRKRTVFDAFLESKEIKRPLPIALLLDETLSPQKKLECLALLNKLHIALDIQDEEGKTVLDYAIELKWKEGAQLLCDMYAERNIMQRKDTNDTI